MRPFFSRQGFSVALFCPTFLKSEMLHVDRQIAGLKNVTPTVFAFKRENQDRFPFEPVELLPRSPFRWARRIWKVQITKTPQLAFPSEVRGLSTAMDRRHCQLLHIYFGNNGLFWLPWIRQTNLPTIVSFHGADVQVDLQSETAIRLLNELANRVSKILVRSVSLGNALQQIGCPQEKIELQRTGIPLEIYRYHSRIEPKQETWKILQACRLIPKKGLEKSIDAFAILRKEWPNAKLIIAGEGPLRTALEDKIHQLELGESVQLTGFVDSRELKKLYDSSHLFLHPSETTATGDREGVPNSLLEAMATGLPCIATVHGGIPEAIQSGHSGILVPEEAAAETIAKTASELLRQSDLRQKLGEAAAQIVRQEFDLQKQIGKLENIYLSLGQNPQHS
jgi:colanic acid/amylovoran biosynthesis glycosyltransferase